MFDSLADRIREDDGVKTKERVIRWVAMVVITTALFGGLYYGVKLLG